MRTVERGITREALRACPARLACMPRLAACILLSVLLALVPLEAQISNWDGFGSLSKRECVLSLQKSEAKANPAAVAAGAALSALAVELGISEGALMAAIAVSAAGATGLAVNMALDPQAPPAPGFKPWDDLTPEEKGIWGDYNPGTGTGGDIETYQKNAIGWWALQYGLLETGDNGGFEPSQEPDPNEDPEGHSKWVKARNVMIALGAGAASVAVNDAVSPLIDDSAKNVRDLLFGVSDSGLQLDYKSNLDYNGRTIKYRTYVRNVTANRFELTPTNWYVLAEHPLTNTELVVQTPNGTVPYVEIKSGTNSLTPAVSPAVVFAFAYGGGITASSGSAGRNLYDQNVYLNAICQYQYRFPDGSTYQNGNITGNLTYTDIDYGQMVDTPEELQQTINQNNAELASFFDDYASDGDGNYRGIAIPTGFSEPGYNPTYPDLIRTITPSENVPIPDDVVYPGTGWNPDNMPGSGDNPDPNPDPNPNPNWPKPNPDFDYPDSIGEAIDNLGNAVFDQLFPFCLIGDIRRLCEKFKPEPQNVRTLSVAADDPADASQYSFVLPLSDFNIDGVDDMSFEIGPLFVVGNMVRPWWTVLFAAGLIAESVRYFLK